MTMPFPCSRELHYEILESLALPAASAVALTHAGGLAADLVSKQAPAEAATVSPGAASSGSRAAVAVLLTLNGSLNANSSPAITSTVLTVTPSSAASSAAIEVQAILESPSSFINSTIQDVNDLYGILVILDPSLGMQTTVTSTAVPGGEYAIASTDLLVTMFNDPNNRV